MAIRPQQLDKEYTKRLDYFETVIDAALVKHKGSPTTSIHVDVPSGMTYADWEVLKLRYFNAGWNEATYHSDQREGEWLTFKA